MESNNKSSFCQETENEVLSSSKFQKRVKSFLSFNFFIFILMLVGIKIAILWKISIIWGAFLAFSAWSGESSKCGKKKSTSQHSRQKYGRPQRPDWRDKDLV